MLEKRTSPAHPYLWWRPQDLLRTPTSGIFPSSLRRAVHSLALAEALEMNYARTVREHRYLVVRHPLSEQQRDHERALLIKIAEMDQEDPDEDPDSYWNAVEWTEQYLRQHEPLRREGAYLPHEAKTEWDFSGWISFWDDYFWDQRWRWR